jgi:microcystin-dependent protein
MPGGIPIPPTPILVPIGSVVAWLKSITNTPALPSGWIECNGQTLNDAESPYNGQVIANLNSQNRFLRGNTTSGGTGGESTHTLTTNEMPSHSHSIPANPAGGGTTILVPTTLASGSTISTAASGNGAAHENKPPYYDVVWIMRVK